MSTQALHHIANGQIQNGHMPKYRYRKRVAFFLTGVIVMLGIFWATTKNPSLLKRPDELPQRFEDSILQSAKRVDSAFEAHWESNAIQCAPKAPWYGIVRRISLGLVGNGLSLEEFRTLESIPEADRVAWWTEYLLSDRRFADHLAEHWTRATVGTNNGPFLLFRRRKYVSWLADEFQANQPFDRLVTKLITAKGSWTDSPEVNFLTATMDEADNGRPDAVRLAGRTSRAFLAMRIDCLQCHNDYLGNVQFPSGLEQPPRTGQQSDFHQLAAFYSSIKMENPFSGLRNEEIPYRFKYLNEQEESLVRPEVPFNGSADDSPWCAIEKGTREELAAWVTHKENRSFARAVVNRFWAILTGKPLVDPVDAIPIEGPFPPGLEELADDFTAHNYDVQRLIRVIVASKPFQLDSRWANTTEQADLLEHGNAAGDIAGESSGEQSSVETHNAQLCEQSWASFPITQLRPEQMAACIHQACRLKTIDASSSIISQLELFGSVNDFTKAYGDRGEDEFMEQSVTIPQRLLMMNGDFLSERIDNNPIMNASTRIASLARDDATAIDNAFLSTLNRLPTSEEREHFLTQIGGKRRDDRSRELGDIYWALLNSSEFQWNH